MSNDLETELKHLREFSAQETAEKEKLRIQVETLIQEVQTLRKENIELRKRADVCVPKNL
jgi:regulator of replication initiation timing